VSRADMKIYVLQNAGLVAEGDAVIKDTSEPIGSNVFVWQGGDGQRLDLGGRELPRRAIDPHGTEHRRASAHRRRAGE
jgi:hypothetical protein